MFKGIADLPIEVLGDVFYTGAQGLTPEESNHLVLAVTHVCQSWRATALGRSSLFSSIDLMWEPDRRNAWLARSGAQPLNLYLHQSYAIPDHWDWSALVRESSRWRSVDVHMADETRLVKVIDTVMSIDTLPNLEFLSLGDGNDPPTHYDLRKTNPRLPALRTLAIEYLQLDHVEIIGEHLTSLTVTGMEYNASEWISIFQTSSRLQTLQLYGNTITDYPLTRILLSDLHQLRITWTEECTLGFIFRNLECPNLETLYIELNHTPRNRDSYIDPMFSFFQRVPKLTDLTVVDDGDPDEDHCSQHILDMLAHSRLEGTHDLLPALRDLSLYCDGRYLRAFIESRLYNPLGSRALNSVVVGKVLDTLSLNRCSAEEHEWLACHVGKLVVDPERICVRPQWAVV